MTLVQIWWRNQKLSKEARVRKIQHYQTTFMRNAKVTSLGRKHKRKKKLTQNKLGTIKKMIIGSCILIITLCVNGLNALTKRQTGWVDEKCVCMHFCGELTHLKRPWCWERLRAGREGDDGGGDGWMASPTRGHGSGWTLGVGDGQGGLACRGSWGHKESDMTERLNWTELNTLPPTMSLYLTPQIVCNYFTLLG